MQDGLRNKTLLILRGIAVLVCAWSQVLSLQMSAVPHNTIGKNSPSSHYPATEILISVILGLSIVEFAAFEIFGLYITSFSEKRRLTKRFG